MFSCFIIRYYHPNYHPTYFDIGGKHGVLTDDYASLNESIKGSGNMTNSNFASRKPTLDPDKRQLSQEEKWKSLERSFNQDFIKKVKEQHDGAERLQMA